MLLLRFALSAKLGLGDDEAYYWDWSRRLEWSYYDHPAMTAWLIKLSTLIWGQTPLGVRFFAWLCNGLSGYFLWVLAARLFDRTVAAIAFALYLFAPIFSLGGILMVPDAPMGLAWMILAVLIWRIYGEGESRWPLWISAAVVLGLGLLSKYTLILLAGSFVLLLLSDHERRGLLRSLKFWSTVAVAAVMCSPILFWNFQRGWPTLQYHLKDRQSGGGGANFTRWLQFWVSQAIALGPALLVTGIGTWFVAACRRDERRWRFLLFLTLPTFALFCLQALFAEFKPHWPAPAYSLLMIGVAAWMRDGFGLQSPRTIRCVRGTVISLILLFFVPLNLIFNIESVMPLLPKIARVVVPQVPWDPKFDPTNDLFGWDEVAKRVGEIRAVAASNHQPVPFVSSSRYQLTAQLAFALQERVWRVSPDKDQYMFWQSPEEEKPLIGTDSLYITDNRFDRDPSRDFIFKDCVEESPLLVYRGTELARQFHIWNCHGYLGLRR